MPDFPQWPKLMMPTARYAISAEEAARLRELYEELPYAAMRAAEALRTDGAALRGDNLLRFSREEAVVAEIIRQINEILEPELATASTP